MTEAEKVLVEFIADVRLAYLGRQRDSQLKHTALAQEWPDLCETYYKAAEVMKGKR